MTRKNKFNLVEIILVAMVWLVLIAAPVFFRGNGVSDWRDAVVPFHTLIPLLVIFLINRFLLVPQFLFKKRSLSYLFSVAGLIAVFTLGAYFFLGQSANKRPRHEMNNPLKPPPPRQERFDKGLPPPARPQRRDPIPPFANLLLFSILLVGFDTGLKVSFRLGESEREKAKLEKEHVDTQLAFLRNQVSPHFFMNTLNNIHSLIDINTEEAKEAIIRLSKLMRHLLYDSEIEKIPIRKEVEFIKNYVDLMKLRFSDKVKISMRIPEQLPEKSIPPLLFTSYVENAFKHGISYQHASFIDMVISCTENNLTFEIKNSNPQTEKEGDSAGIGIENSRKRLDLIFGSNYTLKVEDRKDEYFLRLSIPI